MNDTVDLLIKRKSIRNFTSKEISNKDKEIILDCIYNAPTAGNQQLYSIINVTDESLKERLSVTCDNQPFIKTGKFVLVFLVDLSKWYNAYNFANAIPRKPDVGDLFISIDDALIASANAVVAAESLGIGSCYIGDIMENYEIHKELFNLPKYVYPVCMLVFGYPDGINNKINKPKRFDSKYITFENKYIAFDEQNIREMFKNRCNSSTFDEYIKAFCNRKYNSDFSKEMSRSVNMMLKDLKGE